MRAERYTYLDLIRGLSALTVLVVHYRWFYAGQIGDFMSALQHPLPLRGLLEPLYIHGGKAVQAFWMLSGVIFFIKYGEQGARIDVKKFAVWRFARLYPLHFATLLLVAAIQLYSVSRFGVPQIYAHNDLTHFLMHLFMASNWLDPQDSSFNSPIWSVSIEVLVYALFVAYVRFARPRLWKTAVLFLLLAEIERLTNSLIPLCGALFFLGGLVVRFHQIARPILGRWMIAGGLVLPLLVAALALHGSAPPRAIFYLCLPALMLLALILDDMAPPVPRAGRWIGDITYSTYLMHMPILMIVKMWLDQQPGRYEILASPAMLLAWLGGVILIAIAVFRWFERPAQSWIQARFHAGRARNALDREEMKTI
jgi:peptidoglycan/LPS O-acetylase OafA/YrhL